MAGISNIRFTKTVAFSLTEAISFALRNSIMDDTEAWDVLEHTFQNSKLGFKTFPAYI